MRYFFVTFYRKPNGQIDEQIAVGKRVKPIDLQNCNIIMDYGTKKIEKCLIEGKSVKMDWNQMNDYYKKVYPSIIEQLEKNSEIEAKAKGN